MRRTLASLFVVACAEPAGPTGSTGGSSTSSGAVVDSSGSTSGTTGETSSGTPTTGPAQGSGTGSASESTGEPPPFVLDCHTQFTADMRLALACNLPAVVIECEALPVGDAPCADLDLDGLVDVWEDQALALLHPLRRFDEEESLIDDAAAVLADVGRVAPAGERVRLFVMLGYSLDYGSCGGFTGHNGDSERVALDLLPVPALGPGGAEVVGAYTAAHENTANDYGQLLVGAGLVHLVFTPDPVTADPRWVVFPSADKHATYASVAICENVSLIPCIDEDCGPDDVDDPALFDRLPPIVNAGEETAPRVTDLTALGFPGEHAWALQDFCGGLGGTGCSSPVREKLLVDPFL